MKRIIISSLIAVFATFNMVAQKSAPAYYVMPKGSVCDTIYNKLDVSPSFPDGPDGMYYFFNNKLDAKYANELHPNITSKRIYVELTVDKEGKILAKKVKKSISKEYDDVVLSVIDKFPKLNPGKVNGRNVCSYFFVALNFLP